MEHQIWRPIKDIEGNDQGQINTDENQYISLKLGFCEKNKQSFIENACMENSSDCVDISYDVNAQEYVSYNSDILQDPNYQRYKHNYFKQHSKGKCNQCGMNSVVNKVILLEQKVEELTKMIAKEFQKKQKMTSQFQQMSIEKQVSLQIAKKIVKHILQERGNIKCKICKRKSHKKVCPNCEYILKFRSSYRQIKMQYNIDLSNLLKANFVECWTIQKIAKKTGLSIQEISMNLDMIEFDAKDVSKFNKNLLKEINRSQGGSQFYAKVCQILLQRIKYFGLNGLYKEVQPINQNLIKLTLQVRWHENFELIKDFFECFEGLPELAQEFAQGMDSIEIAKLLNHSSGMNQKTLVESLHNQAIEKSTNLIEKLKNTMKYAKFKQKLDLKDAFQLLWDAYNDIEFFINEFFQFHDKNSQEIICSLEEENKWLKQQLIFSQQDLEIQFEKSFKQVEENYTLKEKIKQLQQHCIAMCNQHPPNNPNPKRSEIIFITRNNHKIFSYNTENQQLDTRKTINAKIGYGSSSIMLPNGNLFVCSGFDPTAHYIIEPGLQLKETQQIQLARSSAAIAYFDNKVYIFGGSIKSEKLNKSECFNFDMNQWKDISPMPVERSSFTAATAGYSIYLGPGVGGSDYNQILKYEPWTDIYKVTSITPQLQNIGASTLYSMGNIFVISRDQLLVFNAKTEEKVYQDQISTNMWHSRMVEYDGKDAYLCITSETNKTILHFIKFDTESRQFEEIYTFRP